jgi:2'-5' RNA ligase
VRLFVALQIPAAVREALANLVNDLRQIATTSPRNAPKWVRTENLHVTLKFIGEVPVAKLEDVRGALSDMRCDTPVTLDFQGLGFFPNEKQPRVFWAKMNSSANLAALARDVDQSLVKVEVAKETRPFAPHLTLARFEPPGVAENLRDAIQKSMNGTFGSCITNEFHLIESKLKPSGAEYTTLQSFCFAPAEA